MQLRAFALPTPVELRGFRIVVCSCSAAGESRTSQPRPAVAQHRYPAVGQAKALEGVSAA